MGKFYERVMGVYFDDLDSFQILHNARYLLLFERTLGAFWMDIGWGEFQNAAQPDQFHLVRHNEVTYEAPVKGVGKVRVRVWIEKLGSTSLVFGFRVMPMNEDTNYASGRRVIVHVEPKTLESVPWTDGFRQVMGPWLGDGS